MQITAQLPMRYLFGLILSAAPLIGLASCSKFSAINPGGSDTDILFIVNDSAAITSSGQIGIPMPLPRVNPGDPSAQPLPSTNEAPRQAVPPSKRVGGFLVVPDGQMELAPLTQAPYDSVGRYTFNFPSDQPGWYHICTGQLIGSSGVMLTAAHCVWDQDHRTWGTNLRFALDYDRGSSRGIYNWQCAAIVSGWTNKKWPYDFALVKLRGNPPAGVGMDINVGSAHVDEVGYPRNSPYNNEQMLHLLNNKSASNPSALKSTMEEGSSGGAWIISTGTGFSAVSLNSFKYKNDSSTMYGPQLSPTTLKVYDFVSRSCIDRVRPAGASPQPLMAKLDSDDADTVMGIVNEDLTFGSRISASASPTCDCAGANEVSIENESDDYRIASVQSIDTGIDSSDTTTKIDYLLLKPKEHKTLGCSKARSNDGICSRDRVFRLHSDRRTTAAGRQMPTYVRGWSMGELMSSADIQQCVAKCSNTKPTDECLNLGQAALTALAPLGKFVQTVDGGAAHPDGPMIRKEDIITEYGGNPKKDTDVCMRSDLTKSASYLVNHGLSCLVETKTVIPQQGTRTRLSMPATLRGEPTNWNTTADKLSLAAGPATLFEDRTTGPKMDFAGTDSGALNKYYAGDIYAISAISSTELVLATSNGCMRGAYKK